jgi:hypothetical protein
MQKHIQKCTYFPPTHAHTTTHKPTQTRACMHTLQLELFKSTLIIRSDET